MTTVTTVTVECDFCLIDGGFVETSKNRARAAAASAGWQVAIRGRDFCPTCRNTKPARRVKS